MQTGKRSFATLGLVLALAALAPAAVLNVPSATYPTIQSAINAAATGDQVVIAAGTYRESLNWQSKDLTLKGAGADQTIVDPSPSDGTVGPRCLYMLSLSSASRLDGITFQNGFKNDTTFSEVGGALFMDQSSPVITNCAFRGNLANAGGAIYAQNSTLSLNNCTFADNLGGGFGGAAIFAFTGAVSISNCTFTRNLAVDSIFAIQVFLSGSGSVTNSVFTDSNEGGLEWDGQNTLLSNCTFARNNNLTSADGGGARLLGSGTVTKCTFDSNYSFEGGGLTLRMFNGTVTDSSFVNNQGGIAGGLDNSRTYSLSLSRCSFIGNSGFDAGGLETTSPGTIDNCVFVNNSGLAGGVASFFDSNTVLTNSTFIGNYGSAASAVLSGNPFGSYETSRMTMANVIVWNCGSGVPVNSVSNSLTVTSSLIEGLANSTPDASGNFAADPQFPRLPGANGPSDAGDLRLPLSSPAVDAGSDAAAAGIVSDILGLARKSRARVDLGAYEYQNQAPSLSVPATAAVNVGAPVTFVAVAADADGDAFSYQLVGAPAWATIDAATGRVTLNPPAGTSGTVSLVVRAVDSFGASTSKTVAVAVCPIAIERVVVSRKGTTTTVQFDVRNTDGTIVSNVSINSVSLKGIATTTLLPLTYAQLKPGVVKTVQLKFSNVSSGSARLLVGGLCSAGPVNADRTVTVP